MCNEPLFSGDVAAVVGMLATIDLDDEPMLSADKIHDVRPDRLLAHKFESRKRPGAKQPPEFSFCGCCVFPQLPGHSRLCSACATHASKPPHPTLSPHAGRGSHER